MQVATISPRHVPSITSSSMVSLNDITSENLQLHQRVFSPVAAADESEDGPSLPETTASICSSVECDDDDDDEQDHDHHDAVINHHQLPCDACHICEDVCDSLECISCREFRKTSMTNRDHAIITNCGRKYPSTTYYTPCQVRRHARIDSCWLVAGDTIYNATPFLQSHPGGAACLLRSAGGQRDCTRDIQMHSKSARQLWKAHIVGKVMPCPCQVHAQDLNKAQLQRPWWLFWS